MDGWDLPSLSTRYSDACQQLNTSKKDQPNSLRVNITCKWCKEQVFWISVVCVRLYLCSFQNLVPSSRHCLRCDDCLRIRWKIIRTLLCCVVYDIGTQWYAHTYEQFLKMNVGFRFSFSFCALVIGLAFCVFFLVWLMPSVLWRCWLDGRKCIRPVKIWVVRYWRGYLSWARCKCFAYGPADATATASSHAPVKSRMVYLSGTGLPRPLNGCRSLVVVLV